jgi:hypothetical protein
MTLLTKRGKKVIVYEKNGTSPGTGSGTKSGYQLLPEPHGTGTPLDADIKLDDG